MSAHQSELIAAEAAPIFAALGDTTRLSLLSRLNDGQPRSVVQLTAGTGLTRQGVRKHLGVLEAVGLVMRERVGRESRFVYQPTGIETAKQHLERASAQWDNAIERLKRRLEGD
ncbi:MAG TPA: transcriptional regulator [Gammaproteobacteria bacterium]|jgi:DNA-binding transcriptional ArsR family regulator|nr:transcriptional regulator [Gammaproteobacteria bacterium]